MLTKHRMERLLAVIIFALLCIVLPQLLGAFLK